MNRSIRSKQEKAQSCTYVRSSADTHARSVRTLKATRGWIKHAATNEDALRMFYLNTCALKTSFDEHARTVGLYIHVFVYVCNGRPLRTSIQIRAANQPHQRQVPEEHNDIDNSDW